MKKNLGITDRIVRFVIIDLLLGFSFLGFEIPMFWATVLFIMSLLLAISIITGFSLIYQILGISTRIEKQQEESKQD